MSQRLLQTTGFSFLLIPLFALALEPRDPLAHCERFLGDKEKNACLAKVTKKQLDWYAAAACSQLEEDSKFISCLEEVQGATFNPQALELCSTSQESSDPKSLDNERLRCFRLIKNRDFSRIQIQKCAEAGASSAIAECLDKGARKPAAVPQRPFRGFQPLQ